jgi:hypothetical protein
MQAKQPQKNKYVPSKEDIFQKLSPIVRDVHQSLALRDRSGAERYLNAHLHCRDN